MIGKTILHYKILEKLGEGGMGVVYKAEDTKLNRDVAIKFLPRQIAASNEERQRFKIEAQAAAALNHPNIATIHAIEEHDDEMFIVMEYIEGRELKEIVGVQNSEPLPIETIQDFATQIASGLQAAHEKGVTHRDVKSANIMITDKGQVKIMDFGLAKVRGGAQVTKIGTSLGTAAYMSPEQTCGAEADHRSDIWSFGMVLYEMLTGKMPFPGDYEQAVMYSIMNEDPKPISESRDDVPEDLENIVKKCLQKEASDRYQNTENLQADLQEITVGAGFKPAPTKTMQTRNIRPFLFGGVAGLILFTLAGYFFFGRETALTERIPIAVADFVNETDEKELNSLSGLLITSLEKSRHLSVFSRSRMFDVLKQMDKGDVNQIDESLGREICKQANIHALVVSSVRKFGKLYSIDLKILDPEKGDYIFTEKEDGEGQESIPAMIDRLAEKTRKGLKEKEDEIRAHTQKVADATTPNLKAYQHYFQGEQLVNKLQFDKAEQEFRQAISLDSTFALAHYRLAYALDWTAGAGSDIAIEKAMQYINTVPEKEQYMIRAQFVKNAGDRDRAIALYKDLLKLYPEEKEAIYIIGDLSFHKGDYTIAITYLEKVLTIDPLFERAWQHLCWTLGHNEQYQEQLDAAREYKDRIASPDAYLELGHAFRSTHDYKSAIETYREATQRFPDPAFLRTGLGSVYFEQENYQQAEIEFRKLLEADQPLSHQSWGYRALVMLNGHLGRYQELLRLCDRLIELDAKLENAGLLPHAHVLKANWLAFGTSNMEGARKAIQKGLAYQSDADQPFYHALFNTYELIGEYEKASRIEKEHLGGIPLTHRVLNGYKEKAAGNFAAAIREFKFTSQNAGGPEKIDSSYNLALCYFEMGQNKLAIQAARRALGIAPYMFGEIQRISLRAAVYARSFHLLGKIYEEEGDKQLAIENTEKFLDLWKDADPDLPDLIDAKERLARLKGVSGK